MQITVTDISTGKVIHRGWYQRLADVWAPTSEVIAAWFHVSPDDVDCDDDMIVINGKPVASIEHVYRRADLRRRMEAA